MDITELLAFSVKNNASDLHLSAGLPPIIRVDGEMRRLNVDPLDHKQVHALIYEIMNDKQRKEYEENLETDFSFEVKDLSRFRVNAFVQNRGAAAVLRTLPRLEGTPYIIAGKVPGRPLNFYRRAWTRILDKAGLEHFPPHGLRHNYASTLVAAGVYIEQVGHLLVDLEAKHGQFAVCIDQPLHENQVREIQISNIIE